MEGVEGMMKKLQLLKEEKRSIKIGPESVSRGSSQPIQAVAKLFLEKGVRSEVLEQTVGWIWCPAKGIKCKDLGDNIFLISFNQALEKRKALEEGSWMISKEVW
jgi:hypothetical protein